MTCLMGEKKIISTDIYIKKIKTIEKFYSYENNETKIFFKMSI